ncbi:MAG: ABC transporter ATP-binding protein [Acholeplasmatales bacterium]|nr:ABC transporter ATP-binding protein [Acholeplasmatales bacterium]
MIKFENVSKVFNKDTNPIVVFDNLNLEIETNKFISILGRSGSGKSTLLNLIGGIENVDKGNIYIGDKNITNLNKDSLAQFRNEEIGYIFQKFILEPSLSVLDNVAIPLVIRGVDKKEREKKAKEVLTILNLEDRINETVRNLSGGEQQRVCIARALIGDANIILADEPTGNLDYERGQEVLRYLKNISLEGKSVILVTHNKEDAYKYSDYVYEINDGKIINRTQIGDENENS